MAQPSPLSALCTANEVAVVIEADLRMAPDEVFGSHGLVRIVEINRKLLAEADHGRVDFKRGIRND
jgi:hypothetical protein